MNDGDDYDFFLLGSPGPSMVTGPVFTFFFEDIY